MIYPEFLRVRTAITWFVIATCLALLVNIVSIVVHRINHPAAAPIIEGGFAFSLVFPIAGFFAAIIATIIGCNLARYGDNGELVLTLPRSRMNFAVNVLIIDVAGIVIAFALALVLIVGVPLTLIDVWPQVTYDAWLPSLGLSAGAIFLWLSLLAAAGAWLPNAKNAVSGLSWPLFLLLVSLREIDNPPWIGAIIRVLNNLNPIEYLGTAMKEQHSTLVFPLGLQITFVFAVSVIACVIAIAGWNRQEI